jgi:ABC-type multidrug transport system fused ATPase/permease subunit
MRRNEWRAVGMLLPYLWEYKWRVLVAMIFLASAKFANVGVPLALKGIVDALSPEQQPLALPLALLAHLSLLSRDTAAK